MNIDENYYKQFLSGDNTGFEALVLEHKDGLIYFIHRYVKDIIQAEDLAQDAFVEVYLHKERYNFKTSFKTYLYTIGRNKAIDYIRKYNRQVLVPDFTEDLSEHSIVSELEEKVIQKETSELVRTSMKQLKTEYQAAILLVDFEDLSYKEAAGILNKSVPQFKILIFRARKALGRILEKGGYVHEKR